mmetsp:Transcript_16012/g.18099  ORF Transcript_16012/g.18099 Transcript_16012/m.18099 type:complete len:113 (-) Transcript_16012:38-376(-)
MRQMGEKGNENLKTEVDIRTLQRDVTGTEDVEIQGETETEGEKPMDHGDDTETETIPTIAGMLVGNVPQIGVHWIDVIAEGTKLDSSSSKLCRAKEIRRIRERAGMKEGELD